MTETAVLPNREVPGGGRLNPVRHIVRIVVVPPAARPASQESAHGHGHSLTRVDLDAAEVKLKRMDPPQTEPGSVLGTASVAKPASMLEALQPTDIVAIGQEPASVLPVDGEGKPVPVALINEAGRLGIQSQTAQSPEPPPRKLFAHDDRLKDTVLRVWTDSDTIEYQCDKPFQIVEVKRAGWKIYGSPNDPFANGKRKPYRAEKRPGAQGQPLWVWTSGLLPATANNQQYKMTFEIFDENGQNGMRVDPDVVCGDPPPD